MKKLIRRLSKVMDSSRYEPLEAVTKNSARRRRRVPAGHVPVFVGDEMERFAIRADLLSRPAFLELLRQSEAMYGYDQTGVLRIPCSAHLFRRLLLAAGAGAGDSYVSGELARSFRVSDLFDCDV